MLETSRERCDSGCWAWRKPRTSGCWTLGEGRGLCGHHAVSPRGGLHTHSNYFLLFLSLSSLGVGAGGSQLKGRKNEKTRTQSHPQQQNQWEGAKGYFRATKDGNPGRLRVQWMETSKRLWRRQPTVIGSLRPPIGWEKKPPPPPPQPGAVSHSTPVAQLGLGESAPRSAKPRPEAAFARRVRPSCGPAPPRTRAQDSARAPCGLSPWVPNIPQRHVASRTVDKGLKCGRVAKHTLPGSSPPPAGGRALEKNLRWCRVARGTVEGLPTPTSNSCTAPRGGTESAAEPESACPAAGPGRFSGREPPRRGTKDLPQWELQESRPLFPGRARGKRKQPHLLISWGTIFAFKQKLLKADSGVGRAKLPLITHRV